MIQLDRDYSEKRDFIRMALNANVTLKFGGQTVAAICRDLSGTGFQLDAPTELTTGDEVFIHMPAGDGSVRDLDATARVIWTKTTSTGGQLLGVEIEEMR
jgi:hypothetical protein